MDIHTQKLTLSVPHLGLLAGAIFIFALGLVGLAYKHQRALQHNMTKGRPQAASAQIKAQPAHPFASTKNWRLERRISLHLQRPVAICALKQYIFVAADKAVYIQGLETNQWAQLLALPASPTALQANDKQIFVGLRRQLAIYEYSTPQNSVAFQGYSPQPLTWDFGERSYITAILPVGEEIWLADSGQRIVLRFRHGRLVGQIAAQNPATGYPGLIVPSPCVDLAKTAAGDILLNNPGKLRVEIWSPQGYLRNAFGQPTMANEGFAGCCNPVAIACLPDGRIVTAEKGLGRVKIYTAAGIWQEIIAAPPLLSQGGNIIDIATSRKGEILVLDARKKTIFVFKELNATGNERGRK